VNKAAVAILQILKKQHEGENRKQLFEVCVIPSFQIYCSNVLLQDESVIHLIVTLKKIPEKRKSKPVFLYVQFRFRSLPISFTHASFRPLPNPLYGDQTEVCLITPDPHKKVKEKLLENPIASIKKVGGFNLFS
jgi:hypothetical protein